MSASSFCDFEKWPFAISPHFPPFWHKQPFDFSAVLHEENGSLSVSKYDKFLLKLSVFVDLLSSAFFFQLRSWACIDENVVIQSKFSHVASIKSTGSWWLKRFLVCCWRNELRDDFFFFYIYALWRILANLEAGFFNLVYAWWYHLCLFFCGLHTENLILCNNPNKMLSFNHHWFHTHLLE